MQPREAEIQALVAEWMRKADLDYETSRRLADESQFREVVVFHAQQAVEKYLKAVLTKHQVGFPKTHDLKHLLGLFSMLNPDAATKLAGIVWLEPFAIQIRYPADQLEILPGDERKALELALLTKEAVLPFVEYPASSSQPSSSKPPE